MSAVQIMPNARRPCLLRWVSLGLFGLVSVFYVAFGALYASVHNMLWFHAAAVPEAIRSEVLPLYLALMKLIGGAAAALGALGLWVVADPLRRSARWASVALAVAFSAPLVMAAYVAETLAARTGSPTSWHIMGILLAIVAAGFVTAQLSSRADA
jgi:hypothetical protein